MSDSLVLQVRLLITGRQVKDTNLDDPVLSINQAWEKDFTSGSGTGKVANLYEAERTLADGASEALDLAGVLASFAGDLITLPKVKVLAIRNKSATQVLTVGAGSTPLVGWLSDVSDKVVINPGEMKLLICDSVGFTVTPSSADLLNVVNAAGASCIYDVIIAG